jgi:hydrogenase-4 component B
MSSESLLLLVVASAILIAGGGIAIACKRRHALAGAAAVVSQVVASAFVLAACIPILAGAPAVSASAPWSFPIDVVTVKLDALGAFFLAWSLPMTALGTVYAVGYLRPYVAAGRNSAPHFALLNAISLSFVVIYSMQNAFVFLLGWEIAAVAAWLLVIWDYRNQKIRFAGFNYLVSTHIGLVLLVAAFMYMHSKTGSMDFESFRAFLSGDDPDRGIVFGLLGASFALKAAFFPFHTWLPRAHSAAPAHVSALMSGVIHKAGLFGFLRFTLMLGVPDEWMGWCVLAFGALSVFFGVLYTSSNRDIKRVLGYSSTENVGIVAMAFGVAYLGMAWQRPALVVVGITGGVLHIFNHALFKCLLFYGAGAVYRAKHTVDLERLGGLVRVMPGVAALFLVGSVGIAALPPMNGFMSEILIYSGLFSGAAPSPLENALLVLAAAMLAFAGAVSAFSMTRVFGLGFLGTARDDKLHHGEQTPVSMHVAMAAHALGVVVIGLAPGLGVALVSPVAQLFAPASPNHEVLAVLAPMQLFARALALALVVVAALAVLLARDARRGPTWGCGYTVVNNRMQYTGSSFAQRLVALFDGVLPTVRRRRLPEDVFPRGSAHVSTHSVDVVERQIFQVLGQSERFISDTSDRIPQRPTFAFAAGLVVLVVVGLILTWGTS